MKGKKISLNYTVKLNDYYWIEHKDVIVLGHNSDTEEIMKGFHSFCDEWDYSEMDPGWPEEIRNRKKGKTILNVTVIDEKEHLDKMDYHRYPFVKDTVPANIYDKEKIYETINGILSGSEGDTSILILSDDSAYTEDIDAKAFANLIYVQDIVRDKLQENPDFDTGSIDIVVEIIDPKHHDIVNSYDINNVVISNRYISKMITQIGEKEAIYNFYNDILTYDEASPDELNSKEVYIKKVGDFFEELPKPCKAHEFIRAVYDASVTQKLPPAVVIGYVKKDGTMTTFGGNQTLIDVNLESEDKIIVYTLH